MEQWEKEISYLALGLLGIFSFNLLWVKIQRWLQRWQNRSKVPGDPRERLIEAVRVQVAQRLQDSLQTADPIPLTMPDRHQAVGRPEPVKVPQETSQNSQNLIFRMVRKLLTFGQSPSEENLDPQSKIIDIFQREDINGKLLILGNPGAGKTTTLLELARDLITQANSTQPFIPVLLELTNWTDEKRQSIEKWLVAELKDRYKVPPKQTQEWLQKQLLLPMLDGLDELGLERQRTCIQRINQFVQNSSYPHLVVCCRFDEYEQGQEKLKTLNGAVCLQPLNDSQIQQYLRQVGRTSLWQEIKQDETLKELATTPLLLRFIAAAYPQQTPDLTSESESPPERRQAYLQQIFQTYIDRQLRKPLQSQWYRPGKEPSPEQTKRWLSFLAKRLREEQKTEFLIEKMQPSWLGNGVKRRIYSKFVGLIFGLIGGLIVGLIGGLIYGLIGGLIYGLIVGLIFGLIGGLSSKIEPIEKLGWLSTKKFKNNLIYGLIVGLIFGLIYGLIFVLIVGLIYGLIGGLSYGLIGGLIFVLIVGLIYGLIVGLIFGLIERLIEGLIGGLSSKIEPIETLGWLSTKKFNNNLIYGLIYGLIFGLIEGLIYGLIGGLIFGLSYGLIGGLIVGLSYGLIGGLIFGLIVGLIGGLSGPDMQMRDRPNQGIWNSLQNSLVLSGLIFPFNVLLFILLRWATEPTVEPLDAFILAISMAFLFGVFSGGGLAGIQHVILRFLLQINGDIPWNYERFLGYANERKLVQQIGGRYRFVHDLLREHFAGESPVRLTHTITRHEDQVRSIDLSPDGRWLVSGSRDKTAKLWSFATGELQKTLEDHIDEVNCVAFAADGTTFATSSSDRTVKVYQLRTTANGRVGRVSLQLTLEGHSDEVWSLAISPDNRTLASGSRDGTVKIWNLANGRLEHTLIEHSQGVWSLAFHPDGHMLASGSRDRTIRLWNSNTGNLQRILPKNPVRRVIRQLPYRFSWFSRRSFSLHFSPDGQTLISSSTDEAAIEFWEIPTGKWQKTATVHSRCAAPIAIINAITNLDKKLLVAVGGNDRVLLFVNACNDGTIKVRQLLPALWQATESTNSAKFLWLDRFLNVLITILTLICVIVPIVLYYGIL
jgi:sugar lactone lactonase YvrE